MVDIDRFRQTMALAEVALEHLRLHQIPPTPKNYEFWYTYAAGFNQPFNCAVNDALNANGRLTSKDIQALHEGFLSQDTLNERIEEVGGKVAHEINEISSRIEATLAETASYGLELSSAVAKLTHSARGSGVATVVAILLDATRRIEERKRSLEAQLSESSARFHALQSNLESIRYETQNDPLTTLSTRKHFDQAIEQALLEAAANGGPLSLLFADVDRFKSFNDRYGHQTGDQVLRLVALAMRQSIRGQDIACRYGGEEFAIILPRATAEQAASVGEQIREAVFARELIKRSTGENLGHLTVSIGVATYRAGDTPQSLIERADACLYAAKRAGRNRVIGEAGGDAAARSVA